MFLKRWLVMTLNVSSYENLLSWVKQGNRYLQINIMILQTTVIAFFQFKANIEMVLSRWLVMTLPVSSYEELLSRVRSITQETRQLQRQLDRPLLDHNENGELFLTYSYLVLPFSIQTIVICSSYIDISEAVFYSLIWIKSLIKRNFKINCHMSEI